MSLSEFQKLDLAHHWHPCSQMKDYEKFPPVEIVRAAGSVMYTSSGKPLIDAISSWWCKSLGHTHPRIKSAVRDQLDRYEHIIAANTCSEPLATLSARLAKLLPGLDRCFYADNGSTAVEVALKMALQYQLQRGQPQRTQLAALENGYHGETLLALSVSDCDIYGSPYRAWMHHVPKIKGLPYVHGAVDPAWHDIGNDAWRAIEAQLTPMADTLCAIIFEPVLQGAGGMKIYSPDLLRRLRTWATQHDVMLIADEIMTGFGRTGEMFACNHAGITPDFVCLSKGLTSGYAPMAVTLTSTEVYNTFYDDYAARKSFLHSNTFAGYAVAATAANTVLDILDEEGVIEHVRTHSDALQKRMERIAQATGCLANLRGIGYLAAADLVRPDGSPFPPETRMGYQCYQKAVELGAWLRPLGDTIYFLPPLNTPAEVLDQLADITIDAIRETVLK